MSQLSIEQTFQIALQYHRAGQLPQAEKLYRQVLSPQPKHAGALHYLGVIAYQMGQMDAAVDLIRQAIALQPDISEAYCNLGLALRGASQLDQAIAATRQAIVLKPNYPQAYANLGNIMRDQGQLDQAVAAYRQAIDLKPDYAEVYNNLGTALADNGQPEEAAVALRQAIALNPKDAQAFYNIGVVLGKQGQLEQAIIAFRQAIAVKPNFPAALCNLGIALEDSGLLNEAIATDRQAIALKPDYADAYNNLSTALRSIGQPDESIAAARQAIALDSSYAEAHNNLGNVLMDVGQLDQANAAYRQAIALQPNYAEAHSNLLYALHFHPGYDARTLAEEHRQWNSQHAGPLKQSLQNHSNDRNPDRRLRIGYLSPDFREHPVGRFMLPLLAHHDKAQVEVFAYSQTFVADAITQRLRSYIDCWRSITGVSDAQAADLIRCDQIDILVDLTMHTARNRLLVFARKPAPVQGTYLAYCSSTGLETIDYRLSDPYLDPHGMDESIYSEQTIRLPQTYWCYEPIVTRCEINPLPALERGFITFANLNSFCKASEPAVSAWTRILRAVPNSQLLLLAQEGGHRQKLQSRFEREGINSNRVRFVGRMPTDKYFGLYSQIDISLDPFPYGGGTTTCDALWMGTPVISLAGKTAVGRGGRSILSNIGLPELVAHSQDQYEQLAIELGLDLPRLSSLRSTLRQRMEQSPLMDSPRFACNVEAAYRQMWRTWCAIPGSRG
jgi:protein O-GlcNAc transferase